VAETGQAPSTRDDLYVVYAILPFVSSLYRNTYADTNRRQFGIKQVLRLDYFPELHNAVNVIWGCNEQALTRQGVCSWITRRFFGFLFFCCKLYATTLCATGRGLMSILSALLLYTHHVVLLHNKTTMDKQV
jgi:hypothetical protein